MERDRKSQLRTRRQCSVLIGAVQLDDGRDEAETQTCAARYFGFCRICRASMTTYRRFLLSLALCPNPNDVFVFATAKARSMRRRRREFDPRRRPDSLLPRQEVTVAICCCVTHGRDPQRDVLVFRDRGRRDPDFAHRGRQRDLAKLALPRLFSISVIRSSAVMTVTIDRGANRPVCDGLQFLKVLA